MSKTPENIYHFWAWNKPTQARIVDDTIALIERLKTENKGLKEKILGLEADLDCSEHGFP